MKHIINIILGICIIALTMFVVKAWFVDSNIEGSEQNYNEEYDLTDDVDEKTNNNDDL